MYCELENTATWQTYKKSRSARGWREPGNKTLQSGRIYGLVVFIRRVTDQEGRPAGKRQSGASAGKGGGLGSACFLAPLFLQLCTTLHHTEPAQYISLCCSVHCTTLHFSALQCTTLHYTALQCTSVHYTALHCTTLHYTALHLRRQLSGLSRAHEEDTTSLFFIVISWTR